jgi:hypothetical protein
VFVVVRIVVGLVLTVAAFALAGRRLWWLSRVGRAGQPAPERTAAVRSHPGRDAEVEAAEVIGQRKLLKWTIPGVAHALTFWGFLVLLLTIIEAHGDLFDKTFAIPGIGHWANFAVLGPAETCTGDPARRMGNEFVYSMLAAQNIETLNGAGLAAGAGKTIVASCTHCFNTIANEYPQLGGHYEVMHHTQLLARLVGQRKIRPARAVYEKITYHDPCFLGRHNKVFAPPWEIIDAMPGTQAQEMHRCKTAASTAAPAGPGCGWKNASASGSTPSGSTKPSAPTPTRSRLPVRTAWSCWGTPSPPKSVRRSQRHPRGGRRRPGPRPLRHPASQSRGHSVATPWCAASTSSLSARASLTDQQGAG